MIDPVQADAVRDSYRLIIARHGGIARHFYRHLFAIEPELRDMFPGDMTAQSEKFEQTLTAIVGTLDDFDTMVPVAADMGRRHEAYGVEPEHYVTVGAALLAALEEAAGPLWSEEVAAAWNTAYSTLSVTMIEAA